MINTVKLLFDPALRQLIDKKKTFRSSPGLTAALSLPSEMMTFCLKGFKYRLLLGNLEQLRRFFEEGYYESKLLLPALQTADRMEVMYRLGSSRTGPDLNVTISLFKTMGRKKKAHYQQNFIFYPDDDDIGW